MQDWKQFLDNGLLWLVNRQLHLFGWAIVVTQDDSGEVVDVRPEKTQFRGFSFDTDKQGFEKITNLMSKEIPRLKRDVFG